MDGDLLEDNSSSVGASPSPKIVGSFPLLRTIRGLARSPSHTSFPNSRLFLPGTATDHSHAACVQRKLVTSASGEHASSISSPSLDANGGTGLQVFDASDCLTLRLLRVYRMWKEELKEFWVTGDY